MMMSVSNSIFGPQSPIASIPSILLGARFATGD